MKTTEQITLDYYSKNAESFIERTIDVPFTEMQNRFLKYLPSGSAILDFGCGSGRDSLAFSKAGYLVTALDGTREFTDSLKKYGLQTICCTFSDFTASDEFDGIWACASLLHLEKDELKSVLLSIYYALKADGIFYCSVKEGTFQGIRNGRYFCDQTLESFPPLLEQVGFEIIELFRTEDVRKDQKGQPWINAICKKK